MHRLNIGLDLSNYLYTCTHQHRIKSFLCIFFLWPPCQCLDAWLVYSCIKRELQSRRGCGRREKMIVKTFKNPNWKVATKILFSHGVPFMFRFWDSRQKVGKIVLPDNHSSHRANRQITTKILPHDNPLSICILVKIKKTKCIKKGFATLIWKIMHSFGSFSWHQIVSLLTKVRHISSNQMPQTASNWKSLSDLGIIG